MANKYKRINERGELLQHEDRGSMTVEAAIAARLRACAALCEHEPEFDYDSESDAWLLMDYISDAEQAFNVTDSKGNAVIAVKGDTHERGIGYATVEKVVFETGYGYVG